MKFLAKLLLSVFLLSIYGGAHAQYPGGFQQFQYYNFSPPPGTGFQQTGLWTEQRMEGREFVLNIHIRGIPPQSVSITPTYNGLAISYAQQRSSSMNPNAGPWGFVNSTSSFSQQVQLPPGLDASRASRVMQPELIQIRIPFRNFR